MQTVIIATQDFASKAKGNLRISQTVKVNDMGTKTNMKPSNKEKMAKQFTFGLHQVKITYRKNENRRAKWSFVQN